MSGKGITLRTVNKFVSFLTGFFVAYAFSNPDIERFYEPKPMFQQKDYAFLNFYEVDSKDFKEFERHVKGLTRYLQTKPGYLQTRLLKLDCAKALEPLSKYKYIGVQTWFSPDLLKSAVEHTFSQKIISQSRMKNPYNAILYKIVVDDSSYTP